MFKFKNKHILLAFAAGVAKKAVAASASADLPPLPEGEEIYDIMPSVTISSNLWLWLLLLGLAILAALLYYKLKKEEPQEEEEEEQPIIKECPRKVAKRAINELVNSEAYKKGDFKEVCAKITQILKTYALEMLEVGFGAGATSDEFISLLWDYDISVDTEKRIKEICNYSDEVQYMALEASSNKVSTLIKDLKYLIELDRW